MDTQDCLQIAARIDTLLQRELDEHIDAPRMVAEPLYARDVLLVCEAIDGDEAPALARDFRAALAAAVRRAAAEAPAAAGTDSIGGPASRKPGDSSGFGRSRSGASAFDALAAEADSRGPVSGWRRFAPSRWLGGR